MLFCCGVISACTYQPESTVLRFLLTCQQIFGGNASYWSPNKGDQGCMTTHVGGILLYLTLFNMDD